MMLATSNIDVTGDIAALTALVVALTTMIGAIVAAIPVIRRQKETQLTVNATHELVNGVHTLAVAREGQLTDALTTAGVAVPAPLSGMTASPGAPPPTSPGASEAPPSPDPVG
jgi:hypothetical protein